MKSVENPLFAKAKDKLEEIFREIPGLSRIDWNLDEHSDQRDLAGWSDLTVGVNTAHRMDTLVVELCDAGHPRQLRDAINRLLRYRHRSHRNDYLVVGAPFITKDGAMVCEEEKVGYFDLAGNCRLAFGTYFIERLGHPNPDRGLRVTTTPGLYGPKAERIVRVLLAGRDKGWKVVELAEMAKVSLGTVSVVRSALLEREWARESNDGIHLSEPERLLTDWSGVWSRRRRNPRKFFTLAPLAEAELRMAEFAQSQRLHFALTGTAGAWRVAPMTNYIRTNAYWEGDPDGLAHAAGLRQVETGANVHLLEPRDEGVFFNAESFAGVPVVSAIQLYLDLKQDPARGAEAAEHLWKTTLFPSGGKSG